jgi:hypothetical protein
MRKKLATAGIAAGLTAGGLAGLVIVPSVSGAQSTSTTVDAGTSSDATRPDPSTRITDALAPLVTDGTITQGQADKVASTLAESMPMGGGKHMRGGGPQLDAAATALGMTADELRTELEAGQTIAQVAEAKGVDVQTVIDSMVAAEKAKLDEKVAAGDITQDEADAHLAEDTTRFTDMVNNGMPARGDHGHGHGPRGSDADDTTDTTTG